VREYGTQKLHFSSVVTVSDYHEFVLNMYWQFGTKLQTLLTSRSAIL